FVILDDSGEKIFIPANDTGTAMVGDSVSVIISPHPRGKSREGRVTEILKRKRSTFLGIFHKKGHFHYVTPDDGLFKQNIVIPPGKEKEAQKGEKVIVRITRWEIPGTLPEGEIIELLGDAQHPKIALRQVMLSFDLPDKFPTAVIAEADTIPNHISQKEIRRRLDLRKTVTVTIDPTDAKDFDDAVSLEILSSGNYRLGVHIADVSHFVPQGSEIDLEALHRGTSVYLPGTCIPMLPPMLSEEMCSLKPDTDRLSYSVLMQVTPEGKLAHTELAESVIHSHARLSYEEAQEMIDGKGRGKVPALIRTLVPLTRILKRNRLKIGGLDFDLPEVTFAFDPLGILEDIRPKLRIESHAVIEECMLLANRAVTLLCHEWSKEQKIALPFIYRIHETPSKDKLAEYTRLLKVLRIPFPQKKRIVPKIFQEVLAFVKDTPEERLIGEITLRTMQKARYHFKNMGHFGLAFKEYTHFTSPIRRYPDLSVHRLLKLYQRIGTTEEMHGIKKSLSYICTHSSETERKAMEAEREAIKIKQLEFMKFRIGEDFKGIISGVVSFGLFVEIDTILAEGLVHIRDMNDDYYSFNEEQYSLIGRRTRKKYRLGDSVNVRVINVSERDKHLDFILVK
ncbi:MAG: ribonuclease R, partial [Patescibacteria group bacterium]|nr:ribonuclease R [Patescibacteria group bacterium]